jgi:hypothetical protein
LTQALLFSSQVIVPVASHFFDGSPEDRALLDQIYAAFPECLFIEYPYIPEKIPKRIFKEIDPAHFWHCVSRLVGFSKTEGKIETLLFLDVDEIADGRRFSEWLGSSDYQQHIAMKLANYWYFREPKYRAEKYEDSIALVQRRAVTSELLLNAGERGYIYDSLPGPKRSMVTGSDGRPLFHHFSWVRTQEEMLKKVKSWGHKKDRNWEELVRAEFSGPFRGVDFVHGYRFQTVDPPFDIRLDPPQFAPKGKPHFVRVSEEELLKLVREKLSPFWRFMASLTP